MGRWDGIGAWNLAGGQSSAQRHRGAASEAALTARGAFNAAGWDGR
jgi:hypothetical protein